MPRLRDDDPRPRRGGAKAATLDIDTERNLLLRILLHSPKDTVAGLLALAAVTAIIANALVLQTGRHPAPMFGTVVRMAPPVLPAPNPLPRPRPPEAGALPLEPRPMEYRPVEPRQDKPPAPHASEARAADPLASLVKATAPASTSAIGPRPPAAIPSAQSAAARRIAAVQRALADYGYGQLKPTGTIGPETQAAIAKFEREHRMPVTGQVSERLVKELTAAIGHPLD